MTYYNANPAFEQVTQVYCDDCAKGHVPFETRQEGKLGEFRIQSRPWRWSPTFGANCHSCRRAA